MNTKILISPHNDDAVLFASFSILREKPDIIVVFDSYVQPARGFANCSKEIRRREDIQALAELGISPENVHFLGFRDDEPVDHLGLRKALAFKMNLIRSLDDCEDIAMDLWAPTPERLGHEQHNAVSVACIAIAGQRNGPAEQREYFVLGGPLKLHQYTTYRRGHGKTRTEHEVLPRCGEDIARKHRALACYTSQMQIDERLGCYPWFMEDLREYVVS